MLGTAVRSLWSAYLALTRFFGARRRGVRRLAALCLVVLGVHAAADVIDDLVYRVLDGLDLFVDGVVWRALDWLAGLGAFTSAEAVAHAQAFAEWIELEEKDVASKWLALAVELGIDLVLLDFVLAARGTADDHERRTLGDELRASVRELKEALWPLDLERLAVPPAVAGFAVAGTFGAALAVEGFVADNLSRLLPLWRWVPNASAGVGVLVAALLLWRFLPDLLHGALLRSHERAQRANGRKGPSFSSAPLGENATFRDKLRWAREVLRRISRGALLAFVVLPLAVLGLQSQAAIFALVARTGTGL